MKISFGGQKREKVQIDILRYERQPIGEHYDDNWLSVELSVLAGGFFGKADPAILTDELVYFLPQLKLTDQTLKGSAEFTTIEEQLRLVLTTDGRGHVELEGELSDEPGVGNKLRFSLEFDQTQLSDSIAQLEKAISVFPVR